MSVCVCVSVIICCDCCLPCLVVLYDFLVCFFFFKQKTAYDMRISDWSSDVCSSDLLAGELGQQVRMQRRAMLVGEPGDAQERRDPAHPHDVGLDDLGGTGVEELGEAIRGVEVLADGDGHRDPGGELEDRKSTRLNSSH